MDARTAEAHFKEADSLYRDGRYDEALDRLIELDETYPDTPNILFPLARCLRHLGRIDEALAICDDLITRCGDLRALELREFIRKAHDPINDETPPPQIHSIEGLNQDAHAGVLDDLLGPPSSAPPALPHAQEKKSYRTLLISGGIALAVVLIGIPLMMMLIGGTSQTTPLPNVAVASTPAENPVTQQQVLDHAEAAQSIMVKMLVVIVIISAIGGIGALYLTLMIRQKLPYESLSDNLLNASFVGVGLSLLNSILPCIGLIPTYFILRKVYEFTFIDFLIWFAFNAGVGFVIGIVVQVFMSIAVA